MNAIEPLLHQPVAQAVGWALLHFVWQGALIGALTGLVLLALRQSAADVRYVVATIGMLLMLTLPLVTGVQKWQSSGREIAAASTLVRTELASTPRPALSDIRPIQSPKPVALKQSRARATAPSSIDRFFSSAAPRVEPMMPMFLAAWLLGVTLLSLRLLTGWLWIQRLRTHGVVPASESWQRMVTRLARRLHIARTIKLLESTLVDVPTVVGWMKPVVLLPASALAGLAPRQLEAILAHELAHIRRHDYMVNLLQTLVETLLFYHPAVWWLSARIRTERENCCDDLAVSLCGDPVTYATALADLESLRGGSSLAMAANGGSLLQRVRRLLGAPASHAGRGPAWLAGSAAILVICGMVVGADGLRQVPASAASTPRRAQTPAAPPESAAEPASALPAIAATTRAQVETLRAQADALRAQEAKVAILTEAMRKDAEAASQRAALAMPAMVAQVDALNAQIAASTAHADDLKAQAAALNARMAAVASTMPKAEPLLARAAAIAAVSASVQGISERQHESSGNWIWSNNGERLSVNYSGSFDFTDDDADVREVSPGGYLKISDQAWLGRHTVEIREREGSLDRRYYVNGSERPYEPEGRRWLNDNLPKFVRNTGIGADRRVARFLKSGGPSAVMAEISRIDSSYVKRIYFSELFKQASLTPEQYRQAMLQASREVRSDYELATLLISVVDRLPADEASRAAYFNAAAGISSNYELRRVYSTMLKRGPVSSAVLAGILEHCSTIQSDYELSELLRQIVQQQPLDDRTRPAFFKAVSTVQSDYERHRILSATLRTTPLDPATFADVLARAADMHSDYEAASFLIEALKLNGAEGAARAPFFQVVNHITSSYERGRVLQALVKKPDVSKETLLATLRSCGDMPSNYDRAQVLLLVATTHPLTPDLREAYIDAADKLQGYEQGQVMTALVKNERRK